MTWGHHPDAVWEESADGTVVYATTATLGEIVVLEGTAASIWLHLDGVTTPELVGGLAQQTGEEEATIAAPVEDYLAELAQHGLVVQRA